MRTRSTANFNIEKFLATSGLSHSNLKYHNGATIYTQGDPAREIFYIQQGQVKITVISRRGKEAVIGIIAASQFFGEKALNSQRVRMSAATAITDCTILRVSRSEMFNMLHRDIAFADFFIHHLLLRNLRFEEDLIDHLFNSSEKRLARILLLLANFGKEGQPDVVIPKVTQETLAEMIGTTRSRVSFFMNKFRKLGFIEYNGKLKIHSSLLNVVLHD